MDTNPNMSLEHRRAKPARVSAWRYNFKRVITMRFILIRSLLILSLFASTTIHANDLNFNVGIQGISVDFPPTKSEIKGIIWYPTLERAKISKIGPFEEMVARNAKIQKGKFGLIFISHGTQGSHVGHRDTAIYLASKGLIVVSVLHPKDNYSDDSHGRSNEKWKNRPRHISTVLNAVLKNEEYNPFIDENKIAVIGFSAGGYTALTLVGGIPDTSTIDNHCSENSDDSEFCGSPSIFYRFRSIFTNPENGGGSILSNIQDHRFKAAVLLGPIGVLFKDKHSLSNVDVPIRIYRAENDKVLRYPYHAESIRQKLSFKSEYVVVKKANHYSFLAPFPEKLKNGSGIIAKDQEGFDRVKFHLILNQEIFEFLSKSFSD